MESLRPERIWTPDEAVDFYAGLLEKALESIPDTGATIILGPMFIIRTPEENFARFQAAYAKLESQGVTVFNQLPFVDYNLKEAPFQYDIKFEIFYQGLMKSGKIKACYLLPDWEQSKGVASEVRFAKESNVPVYELPKE